MKRIDHVGFITHNISLFEAFWCTIMGFKQKSSSTLTPEMNQVLFGGKGPAAIRRYSRESASPVSCDIEIHQFEERPADLRRYEWKDFTPPGFDKHGINHVCVYTGGPGSRAEFLKTLPPDIIQKVFDNPGGWQNIFIRDYEYNWVELRESL